MFVGIGGRGLALQRIDAAAIVEYDMYCGLSRLRSSVFGNESLFTLRFGGGFSVVVAPLLFACLLPSFIPPSGRYSSIRRGFVSACKSPYETFVNTRVYLPFCRDFKEGEVRK